MALSQDDDDGVFGNTPEFNLQALFDSVLTPGRKHPQQVPWSQRKLPESFFNPTTGANNINHTRESSVDSGAYTSSEISTTSPLNSIPLQTVHHRAHSSPATLQQTLKYKENSSCHHQHNKQRSHDVMQTTRPLPLGWEEARTPEGHVYYLNHITKTTTWENPRKFLNTDMTYPIPAADFGRSTNSCLDLAPLPEGWEESVTPEGEVYFIDHVNCTTSWFDPRIPNTYAMTLEAPMNFASKPEFIKEQDLRLQLLQVEREKLKIRQEELKKQLQATGDFSTPFCSKPPEEACQQSKDSAYHGNSTSDWSTESTEEASSSDADLSHILLAMRNTFEIPDSSGDVWSSSDFIPSLRF